VAAHHGMATDDPNGWDVAYAPCMVSRIAFAAHACAAVLLITTAGCAPADEAGPSAGASASPRPAAKRTAKVAAAKAPAVEKPLVTCPVHFQVLPASGVCDLCE